MKSLFIALVLMSGTAMAQVSSDIAYRSDADDFQVDYISWCEGNNVMAQSDDGHVYLRANCTESNLVCKAVSSYRGHGEIVSASCQSAQ